MLLVGRGLRVALATIHCALREVPGRLSREGLVAVLEVLQRDLVRRFRIAEPRIAVCGLNPHASDGGRFGDEEARIIAPAVADARARGIAASGPYAADSLFQRAVAGEFDAVLAMYHDQGLGPLKTHAFGQAVNVTLGLLWCAQRRPRNRFDIAGRERRTQAR
jgi:4-hydroxythreonine-4-phosphate dehydrogenase